MVFGVAFSFGCSAFAVVSFSLGSASVVPHGGGLFCSQCSRLASVVAVVSFVFNAGWCRSFAACAVVSVILVVVVCLVLVAFRLGLGRSACAVVSFHVLLCSAPRVGRPRPKIGNFAS